MKQLLILATLFAMPAFAQLSANDDSFGSSGFLRTVWTHESSGQDCIDYNAQRCYVSSGGRLKQYDKDGNTWVEKKNVPSSWSHESPLDTQCTLSGSGSCITNNVTGLTLWVGTQWSSVDAWQLPMAGGGCSDTVWGCNPLADSGI